MTGDPADFIRAHLKLARVPALPGLTLYRAHAGSRLSRLGDDAAPYWAFCWAGGLALAHHIRAHPETVAGKSVLDLGAGSGLVGIVAAQAGARVAAAEIDAYGRAAIGLNASANGVRVEMVEIDLAGPVPSGFEMILAGDVFYNPDVAQVMLPFLQRCQAAGMEVLIGDPDRRDLPLDQLDRLASYAVGDVGDARTSAERWGAVYRLR